MNTSIGSDSPLGREVAYPTRYDPGLLCPIPRHVGRAALGLANGTALPFVGHDRWQAYELSWLDAHGKPQVATATFCVPADSPCLIESKSLKLYLNSLNFERFDDAATVGERIAADLSTAAGAAVTLAFGLPAQEAATTGDCIDGQAITVDRFGPPDPALLVATGEIVKETLHSGLLKSNCPVTGQPDWADLNLHYRGPRIDRAGLLRYLVGFRNHADFHEQCVERIFIDVLARCAPSALAVEARYTRRGGLDINPWRAAPGLPPPPARRTLRQ